MSAAVWRTAALRCQRDSLGALDAVAPVVLGAVQRRVGAGHQALAELLDLDALEQDLVDATSDKLNAKHVTKALASNPPLSWREVVENDTSKPLDDLDERARTLLTERGVGP